LGLALEVYIDKNGNESLRNIWDYRDDNEGIYFDYKNSPKERIDKAKSKADFINREIDKRKNSREQLLGSTIEPI